MPAEEHIQYVPEPPGVDNRVVLSYAAGALVLLAGTIGWFHFVYRHEVPVKTVPAPHTFPQPRLLTSPAEIAERQQLEAAQTERLQSWGWADDRHTLVQIPIERAMSLLVQKGGEAYAPLAPPQPALSSPTAGAQNATTPDAPAPSNPSQEKQP